ncbi:MAG: GNAT family N-acetyltransferase [Saprospiraceae bacterium]|nr:GNAT family N-acetyltransferase [Saprospiraceae bacterium]MDW8484989.1 GNAT family N-acetyltransferase [Saprospiraceae bacterium]
MESKQGGQKAYRAFCTAYVVPLSHQPWWLDAVCGPEGWGAAANEGGIWPYVRTQRWGIPIVQLPPYTAYAGPWLVPLSKMPSYKRLRREQRTITELVAQLPRGSFFFRQNCLPDFTNGLPLLWSGFRLSTRYTYCIAAGHSVSRLHAALKHTLRTELRHAAHALEVETTLDADLLFAPYAASLRRRGIKSCPKTPFIRLVSALQERKQGIGWIARHRAEETAIAGLLLAFDSQRAAVLTAGRFYHRRLPGALHCLYWEAICFCAQRGLHLDFEGSMAPGLERVFRAFGAQPQPYLQLVRPRWIWW